MKLLLHALFLFLFVSHGIAADRPNIIIVMPDDMGYGDLGATGNPVIRTPNLDRLAGESAELTNFYVSPVCSPTRASLMTGRYNYRTRVVDTFKGRSMMAPEEFTIAEALQEEGYRTGIFGKWHLGDNYPMRPQDQGFDEVLIHRGGGLAQPSEPIENEKRYTDPILFRNGEQVQTKGYCTDIYFDAAMEFIGEAKEADEPFFVYLPPNAPHGPYHDVPEDLLAYYQSIDLTPILNGKTTEKHIDTVARVFAMIENIDQNMGRLDAYLERESLLENTIVLFLIDNGPNTMRYAGPFRAMKGHVHEGGIRSMFYARWPERLDPSAKSDQIAAHIDVMPTLLEAAGVELPDSVEIDGKSLLPLLTGTVEDWEERTLFLQSHRGDAPIEFHHIAARDSTHKLVHPTGFGKEEMQKRVPFELYNIHDDPAEASNLAESEPEKLAQMKALYQEWLADVSATRPDNYEPPRIIIGSDEEPVSVLSIQDWRVGDVTGWGTSGTWMVDVVSAGPYTATVEWDKAIGEREVTVVIGDQRFPGTLAAGATKVEIPRLELPTGETGISVEVSGKVSREEVLRFLTLAK